MSLYQKKKKMLLVQKRKTQEEIKELIERIKNMNLEQYLKYLNGDEEEKNEEEENEEETEDESLANIIKLKRIQKNNKNIKYNLIF